MVEITIVPLCATLFPFANHIFGIPAPSLVSYNSNVTSPVKQHTNSSAQSIYNSRSCLFK